MDQTRLQNTRKEIIFVPRACIAFPSSYHKFSDMIFGESKIDLFKVLNITVIRLGNHYYKKISPQSKYVYLWYNLKSISVQSSHATINGPAGPPRKIYLELKIFSYE